MSAVRKISHAERTEYPDLYRHFYWGCFRCDVEPEIITARNSIAAAYDLVDWCRAHAPFDLMDTIRSRCFDHPEAYRDSAGRVVCICSPYAGEIRDFPEWARELFQPIVKVYAPTANSFLYRCSMDELKAVIRELKRFQVNEGNQQENDE